MKRTSILLFVAAACSRPPAEKKLSALDSTFAVVCGVPSDSVPFTRIDFGPARTTPGKQVGESRELIQTETEWKDRWAAFGDSTPAPALNFQDSILVVVASEMSQKGPFSAEIESARRCLGTNDIVVPVRVHTGSPETNKPERSIRAIQIARADWKHHQFTFVSMQATTGAR